jgi:basic membrane protein A
MASRALIESGCDVIAQHCNTPAPQTEAEKAGMWGIGFNSDMKGDAPNATIASVVWNWGAYYTHLVRSVIDGSFTTEPYFGDISDGIVELTPLDKTLIPPGVEEAVARAETKIVNGEIGVFDGVMETNDGRTVGIDGRTLSDEDITGRINWYYRNVIVQ